MEYLSNKIFVDYYHIIHFFEVKKISGLANEFDNSNSDATDALKARQSEYNRVNNALIALAANGVSVLEKAKLLYEHEDMLMQNVITENYSC